MFSNKEKKIFLKKIANVVFIITTGSLGTLSFSPYQLWFTSIISMFGLLNSTINSSPAQSAFFGFIWGIGLFGTGISWILIGIKQFSNISIFFSMILTIFLIFYLSLYPTTFSYFLIKFWPNNYRYRFIFGAPSLWVIIEFIRGSLFTGFPWLEFGYSQTDTVLKTVAPIFGVIGITFLIVMISGIIVYAILRKYIIYIILACFLFFFPSFIKEKRLYQINENKKVSIALIQGNIFPNKEHFYQNKNSLDIYLHYTFPLIGKVKIIIWPESTFIKKELENNILLKKLNEDLYKSKTRLITGIINIKNKYNYYNSIIVLGRSMCYTESSKEQYNKYHLVPFGEIIPNNKLFKSIIQFFNLPLLSFNSGSYIQKQLKIFEIKITPSICYEAIFGEQIKDNFSNDTDFLLTISNNIWFGNSIGPQQFFQMVRMRSLELGRSLLFCSNDGMTSIISPNGKVKKNLSRFTRGILTCCIAPTIGKTPYSEYGSYPILTTSIFFTLLKLITKYFYLFKKIF